MSPRHRKSSVSGKQYPGQRKKGIKSEQLTGLRIWMVLEVIIRNLNRILTVMVINKSEFYPGEGQHLIDADEKCEL